MSVQHGMYGTPTYSSWSAMLGRVSGRCSKPAYYSGVTVCDAWKDFRNFLSDMGERPDGMTLDRYPDPKGNYEPTNCRWATLSEQAANRSNVRVLTINGVTRRLADWAADAGLDYNLVRRRIGYGWTPEMALSPGKFNGRKQERANDAE